MGGVEGYLEGLATILHPNADLFAICTLEVLAERLERRGVRVIRIPGFSRIRILRFLMAFLVLPWVVMRHRINVVQINGFLESILLVPARILLCETIYTRHGPFETELFKWYRHPAKFTPRILSRYFANLASRLVCVSETVGALYKPIFPFGRVIVIPNWVSHLPEYESPIDRHQSTHAHHLCGPAGEVQRTASAAECNSRHPRRQSDSRRRGTVSSGSRRTSHRSRC